MKKKSNIPEQYVLHHLQKKKFTIKINKYTKTVPDNIFKASYIRYEIECLEAGWKTARRFNDFVWLRSYLMMAYRGVPVPPIPEKTTIRSFDEKHIEYRMKVLERFLNTLIRIPETCSDLMLEAFLRGDE